MKYTPFLLLLAVLFSLRLNAQIKPPDLDHIRYMTDPADPLVRGSGAVETEVRNIEPAVHEIIVGNGIQLFILPGDGNTLKVAAQKQVLPLVLSEIKDHALSVRLAASLETTEGIRLYVHAGRISKITVKEGAYLYLPDDVRIDDLDLHVESGSIAECSVVSGNFSCTTMGGSTLHLSGTATREAKIVVLGGSVLEAKKFECARCQITVLGASNAKIRVSEALNARVENESRLVYFGNPAEKTVKTALNGKIRQGLGL